MTKTYVYKDDIFDNWRVVTNDHSDQIGNIAQKHTNASQVSAYLDQQYLSEHADLLSASIAGQAAGATVTIAGSSGRVLRKGMKVEAFYGINKISDDYCTVDLVTYSGSDVVVTLSHALVFTPTPATIVFNFYVSGTSFLNDLEIKKLNRNGDRMTEGLVIDSLTTVTGSLSTNELNFDLLNTTATAVNAFGAATTIVAGATTGTATIRNANVTLGQTSSGTTTVNSPTVNISTGATGVTTIVSTKTSTTSADGSFIVNGGTGLKGTLNVAGVVKTELTTDNGLGSLDGAVQILGGASIAKNLTIGQDLRVTGADITIGGNPLVNAVTPANAAGLYTTTTGTITIGAGNTTPITVNGNVTLGTNSGNSVAINSGSITTPITTTPVFGLLNTNVQNVNAFGAALILNVGAAGGVTNFAGNVNLGATTKEYRINGVVKLANTSLGPTVLASSLTSVGILTNLTVAGNVTMQNGNLITSAASSNLFNTTATTLNIGGAGTAISIGAGTGTTTVNNTLVASVVDIGLIASLLKYTATIATTSEAELFFLDKTIYRSAEVIVQATQGSNYTATKFIMMHDGTDSYETEFGSLGTPLGTYNSIVVANSWSLKVTQTAATSTVYKIFVTAVKV